MGINVKDARWPGCSAKNFGRFIPCRGGGTATTYYTDFHLVDEDAKTIAFHGGDWLCDTYRGVTARELNNIPSDLAPNVASRLIYLS